MGRSTVVRNETAVGAFVLLSVGLLVALLVVKGTRVGFGSREVVFHTDAGHDLKRGAAVKMQGIEVGEVSAVTLERDNAVLVRCKIFPDYIDNVHGDAVAIVDEPPLLGSTTVALKPGRVGAVEPGQELRVEDNVGIMSKVASSTEDMKKIVDKVNRIADKADATLGTVAAIVSKVNEGQGLVGRLVSDEKLADEVVSTTKDLRTVLDDVKDGKGAFALLKDEHLAPDLRATVADVRSMTDAIARGDGAIGRLMTNGTIVVESENVLKDVRGALARLDDITKETTATTSKVQQILETANGTLKKLDGTIRNTEKITGDLAGVTEKVNKGQGTLAKLVNDDALFRETKSLLKELRESVEDLREQAPINSFIGVVFSAF